MNVCTPARSASEVVRGLNPGLPACETVDAERSMPAQNASPSPVMSTARTFGIGAELAHGFDDAVAHADRQRVLRLGSIEHDPTDAVDVAFDAEVGLAS